MQQIRFDHTARQFWDGSKTVTRRLGWGDLEEGERLMAIKEGGVRLGEIEVISVRHGPLSFMNEADVRMEGFGGWTVEAFIQFYCETFDCSRRATVTVIEFEKVGPTLWTPEAELWEAIL